MQKELAIKHSWSGLGDKRKKTKKSFRDHKICAVLNGNSFSASV